MKIKCSYCGLDFETPMWKKDSYVCVDYGYFRTTPSSVYTNLSSATTVSTWRGWVITCPYCGMEVEWVG
ncbi:MAG: hypothetical protein QXT64_06955 [Desulfurococcaceae archaeon]